MFKIDLLRLHLPANFTDRADLIARTVAKHMAGFQPRGNVHLEQLQVPPVQIDHNSTDEQIATKVSNAVESSLAHHWEK